MEDSYVYMIRCGDGSLYTGIAKDLGRRLAQHCGLKGGGAKYTGSHGVAGLEAAFAAKSWAEAARLEYAIKQLRKSRKEELVKNPQLVHTLFAERLPDCHYRPVETQRLHELNALCTNE